MHLHVISPLGFYTSLDLAHLPVWRLELGVQALPPRKEQTLISLMVTYLAPGSPTGFSRLIIAAVDSQSADNAAGIAGVGFPYGTKDKDRARLNEAAGCLSYEDATKKEAPEIAASIAQLADLYHDLLDALAAVVEEPAQVIGTLDAPLRGTGPFKGSLGSWRFAVTKGRFDAWRGSPDTWKPAGTVLQQVPLGAPAPPQAPDAGKPAPPKAKQPTREQARTQRNVPPPPANVAPPNPDTSRPPPDHEGTPILRDADGVPLE